MLAAVSPNWKLALTVGVLVAMLASIALRAPRQPTDGPELRRLILAALLLYGVGAVASLTGHGRLAAVVYACGILVCSVAVWLSRGRRRDDGSDWPPRRRPPEDEEPPGGPDGPAPPDGLPPLDWDEFDRQRARWRPRAPTNAS